MYKYKWDANTGGLILTTEKEKLSKEPRPVYYRELNILGFDKYFTYPQNDDAPIMWAEANNYIYRGECIASTIGGSLYNAPKLKINANSELSNKKISLLPVDIKSMIKKNRNILEILSQNTMKDIYDTYVSYKNKVDVFYVAFSGGKDSIVALDLVQKTLPHNDFKVLFGDTRMEFPDTYSVVNEIKEFCNDNNIEFYVAKSKLDTNFTWHEFGPPAQRIRWCCSVHKTTPQILLMRELMKDSSFRGMALTGIRADESVNRSQYDDISFGEKHKGQYSFHTILHWNSSEIYLYIYTNNLIINEAYKKGNSRVGCLVCPMATDKNFFFKEQVYNEGELSTTTFNNYIRKTSAKEFPNKIAEDEFMDKCGWKARRSGRELNFAKRKCIEEYDKKNRSLMIKFISNGDSWREWIKTLGMVDFVSDSTVEVIYRNKKYILNLSESNKDTKVFLQLDSYTKDDIYFMSALKIVFRKAAYCIGCQVCVANCPYGYISMENSVVSIDDKCIKCQKCHDIFHGCLVANSLRLPEEEKTMVTGSVNRYQNFGIRQSWIDEYFKSKDEFWDSNGLGSKMITAFKNFLSDANVCKKKKITSFGNKIAEIGYNSAEAWGLMISNLVYTPQFNWWIMNLELDKMYDRKEIIALLGEDKTTATKNHIVDAYRNIFSQISTLKNNIYFGWCDASQKGNAVFKRGSWINPIPEVILYSLYKFAENCGGHYQFTVENLFDDDIERDGISPTKIFGLSHDGIIPILNGLAINYNEFISVEFTHDLESITLRSDKKSEEVLDLL